MSRAAVPALAANTLALSASPSPYPDHPTGDFSLCLSLPHSDKSIPEWGSWRSDSAQGAGGSQGSSRTLCLPSQLHLQQGCALPCAKTAKEDQKPRERRQWNANIKPMGTQRLGQSSPFPLGRCPKMGSHPTGAVQESLTLL